MLCHAMLGDKHLNENVNDQSLFNNIVRGSELNGGALGDWIAQRRRGLIAYTAQHRTAQH